MVFIMPMQDVIRKTVAIALQESPDLQATVAKDTCLHWTSNFFLTRVRWYDVTQKDPACHASLLRIKLESIVPRFTLRNHCIATSKLQISIGFWIFWDYLQCFRLKIVEEKPKIRWKFATLRSWLLCLQCPTFLQKQWIVEVTWILSHCYSSNSILTSSSETSNSLKPNSIRISSSLKWLSLSLMLTSLCEPWKKKSLGYIPFPKGERSKAYMELFPKFFKAVKPFCSSDKHFREQFMTERSRQYETNQQVMTIQQQLKFKQDENPASCWKYFVNTYIPKASDICVLTKHFEIQLEQVKS